MANKNLNVTFTEMVKFIIECLKDAKSRRWIAPLTDESRTGLSIKICTCKSVQKKSVHSENCQSKICIFENCKSKNLPICLSKIKNESVS